MTRPATPSVLRTAPLRRIRTLVVSVLAVVLVTQTLSAAPAWAAPRTVSGTVSLPSLSIHTGTDVDYFRFVTAGPGVSGNSVRLDFTHAAGDVDMRLYDVQGVELRASTGVTNSEEVSLSGLAAGTYYVKVYGFAGATNNYSMRITGPTGLSPDRFEPNDSRPAADDLGLIRGPTASTRKPLPPVLDFAKNVTVPTPPVVEPGSPAGSTGTDPPSTWYPKTCSWATLPDGSRTAA